MSRYYCQRCGEQFSDNNLNRNMYCSKECANGDTVNKSTNEIVEPEDLPYVYESELVWKKNPSNLPYLREMEFNTRKNKGIPHSKFRDYIIYGWTNVEESSPTIRHGLITKRLFYLEPCDVGAPEHEDHFRLGSPSEAVKPESIESGSKSKKHEVDDSLKGTKWWTGLKF